MRYPRAIQIQSRHFRWHRHSFDNDQRSWSQSSYIPITELKPGSDLKQLYGWIEAIGGILKFLCAVSGGVFLSVLLHKGMSND